jgi:hypothetical protein
MDLKPGAAASPSSMTNSPYNDDRSQPTSSSAGTGSGFSSRPHGQGRGDSGLGGEGAFGVGGLRGELDRLEAANVPLPLAEGDSTATLKAGEEGGKGRGVESPLGPL